MSTLQFKRMARLAAPRPPGGEVHLEPPPEVPRVIPGNIMMKAMPVVMIISSVGMMALMFTYSNRSPAAMIMPGMMLVSTIGMMASGMGSGKGQKKAEMNEDRKDYLRYLGQMRDRAREAADEQRAEREWVHPDPQMLWSLATTRRMWERRQSDPDFCHLRAGRGSQRLATRLVPPQTGPVEELEPIATLALRRFVRAHSLVPDLPISIALRGFAAVGLIGEINEKRGLARALIAQMATFHSPDDLLIAVVTTGRTKAEWEWAKWLPHVQHPSIVDGIGQLRMMASSLAEVEAMLDEQLRERQRFTRNAPPPSDQPHIVIVIDDGDVTREEQILLEEGLVGVTLLDLSESLGNLTARRGLRLVIEDGKLGARSASGVEWFGGPDSLSITEVEALARRLSPYRIGGMGDAGGDTEDPLSANPALLELLGIPGDPMTFDVQQAWRPRPMHDRYRVPFGIGEFGQAVELDIKEAAENGMGPHGLCIGATGSGKSEFLRTLVLGLLATHSSTALNMILVDFKGGATFLGLDDAPHVAATITNLAGDLTLVDRMKDAIAGEVSRRQEVLAKGNYKNVWDYEKARENGADLDPLPALFICIDEFSEMLTAKPDFIDIFLQIGRVGRSLQMHMLLASQRLEEGKLRGLDTYLSYRIGLKTFSPAESRAAIGVPDAYELPPIPGSGYLSVQGSGLIRFKALYVSGPYRPAGIQVAGPAAPVSSDKRPRYFVPDYIEIPKEPERPKPQVVEVKKEDDKNEESELEVIVRRLKHQGPDAHEVWLPPLNEPPTLDAILPPLQQTDDRGLCAPGYPANGRLAVPLGVVDKPFEQRRDDLWADFSGAAGHGAIVGGPQSGKSMMLRTLITSMALTHTPEEVQFYCLDLGGGTLASLERLPHVGGFASRLDVDKARRMVAELTGLIAERERRFRAQGIDSMVEFRNRRRRGEIRDDDFGDAFLVVDGWMNFRQEFEALEPMVQALAAQGLSYGVHLVVAANRWAEIRPAMKDLLGTRLELRLGDPSESDVDRKVAVNVPPGRPGRGLSPQKLHFLVALPRIDTFSDPESVAAGVQDMINKVSGSWRGRHAPSVRLLPDLLPYQELMTAVATTNPNRGHLVPIGVNEDELAPVYLDFDADPHFMSLADGEAGKTNMLRTIVRGIMNSYTSNEALIMLVDYRRTMLGYIETDHLLSYAVSSTQLVDMIKDVQGSMKGRLPGPDVTQDQLRNRSWWKGPELFVIVDDYDLVAPQGSQNPLAPLAEFIPQAKDVGLHVIVVRRMGGASRAMYDPILGKLKEISAPIMVGSGSKEEGAIVGNLKASPQPPGRGTLVTRKLGQQRVQFAWIQPE
ncbi:type VII secretion protein EccC [Actinosynnema pretiosum subsp. pretiosum]|uniref:Cell divisionFtsK/SpoIIIE n=2 Tax=Actinosynnema TaxID=40566 RepID=C6WLY5_ACTMD|nr:type VII secretion protein EccC [Actinosynnema mirum]ACU40370.1 cell divisionFtsK/SpoIIIE [Actinosynnema mirum DSM 43827]AXX33881.1 FtsK/SpoIIIE family protein [Actinosynnema pretiosum subsp. pretiosum]QUF02362.1 type VII secretion protein EccC [Actinosynnema pretiosum subsp. pretiosum]